MSAQILIVDDDPVQRRLLEGAANRLGYSAQLCDGGEAALEAMSSETAPFDAILLDLVMPDIDGLEVMHAMRERDIETPVIVLTAQGGIEVVISAMRAGAFDFLVKPVAPERLKTALQSAVKVTSRQTGVATTSAHDPAIAARTMVAGSEAMDRVQIGRAHV